MTALTHGYDDAIAGRTALHKASARWLQTKADDIRGCKTPSALMHYLYVRGIDVDGPGDVSGTVSSLARRTHAAERQTLLDAPLVYITPGILERFDEIGTTMPDVHALPFAEPTLLWFAEPLPGDPFTPDWGKGGVAIRTPVRAALIRPDPHGKGAIFYQTYFSIDDMVGARFAVNAHLAGSDRTVVNDLADDVIEEMREEVRQYFADWSGDINGKVSSGTDAARFGAAAVCTARALNAMSVREARMVEDDTPTKTIRKAAKRAGVRNPGQVHVIYLPRERKPASAYVPSDVDAHGNPRRRHRVRAHWRRQPYGPRDAGQWRWTRIEAHERGTGARLDDRETVYTPRGD